MKIKIDDKLVYDGPWWLFFLLLLISVIAGNYLGEFLYNAI